MLLCISGCASVAQLAKDTVAELRATPTGTIGCGACAQGYPLRPELMESTFLLAAATGNASYLQAGRTLQATLVDRAAVRCGFASLVDVATGVHGRTEGVFSGATQQAEPFA